MPRLSAVIWFLSLASTLPVQAEVIPLRQAEFFPLSAVRLLDGPFAQAHDVNRRYLLAHDVERFLAPFRKEAGLPAKAEAYPNWESSGLSGHSAGHYLTALAQECAATNDPEGRRRLDALVAGVAECQAAGTDGYVGGIPGGRKLWADVAAGRIDFQSFSLNGAWVPWYNEHKVFAGLRDAWLLAGSTQARDVLVRLGDWCDGVLAKLTDEQVQAMLGTEHGGMNEVLADLYAITGEKRFLQLAERFSHRAILGPLLEHEDRLTGLHANTQIPKVIGFARIAELGGDPSWRDAAQFFWETVTAHRSVAFGGNSEGEHFNPVDDSSALFESRQGPETCNTYNMLRLSEALFRTGPSAAYADYYERALYNHILSSQHPGHGGYVYFTSIRPRHYRVYSQPGACFWCCVGTGMENHGKYGTFIYARTRDVSALYVNLFIASELDWRERGVHVRQETKFPDEPRTVLVLKMDRPQHFALRIRHPFWTDQPVVAVNGEKQEVVSQASSYIEIGREWRNGDRIEVELPMRSRLEFLHRGAEAAVMYGPVVLAAKMGTEQIGTFVADDSRMGHVANGPVLPLGGAPMLVGNALRTPGSMGMVEGIRPVEGKPLTFTARELIQPEKFRDLELVPFFRVHDSRYMLYWRTETAEAYPAVIAALAAADRAQQALEARTLDFVQPGEQQPEVEHGFSGKDTQGGDRHGRRWRGATGWFSYRLDASGAGGAPLELIVTHDEAERDRKYDLFVNDRLIATIESKGGAGEKIGDTAHAIPAELAAAGGKLEVRFVAHPGSRTGSIFGVRLVKKE